MEEQKEGQISGCSPNTNSNKNDYQTENAV